MVGKFQLYSRFITYWLPFCWTKRSQLQRFPSIPHSCTLALSVHRVKGNHSVTIDSNCKHPRSVLGFCADQHECYRQNIIFETISRGFVEDKKKVIALFFNFHYYFMGNLFSYCTCFCTAIVFLRFIHHLSFRKQLNRWWRRLIIIVANRTSNWIAIRKKKQKYSGPDFRQVAAESKSAVDHRLRQSSENWFFLQTDESVDDESIRKDILNDKPIKWFSSFKSFEKTELRQSHQLDIRIESICIWLRIRHCSLFNVCDEVLIFISSAICHTRC